MRMFGFSARFDVNHVTSTPLVPLLISPVLESFVVIGLIELVRRLRFSPAAQIAVAASVSCLLEDPRQPLRGLLVAPMFLGRVAQIGVVGRKNSTQGRRDLLKGLFP